jgi:hypothetical protein
MKTIKKYTSRHKYYTVSARLNYYEMIRFRELQNEYKITSSELIKKLILEVEGGQNE